MSRSARRERLQKKFRFKGKSGVWHEREVDDPRLARIVRNCRDLPGQALFQYVDEAGRRRGIDSNQVNDYLREITGQDFTAKDFRTWAGTVAASMALQDYTTFDSDADRKRALSRPRNFPQKSERPANRRGWRKRSGTPTWRCFGAGVGRAPRP